MVDHGSDTVIRNARHQSSSSERLVAKCALKLQALVGCKAITILAINTETGAARRIYSSASDVFPLFGTKQIPTGLWTDLVVTKCVPAIFTGSEQIQNTFADHREILTHGFCSVLNIPICSERICVGSVNCLFHDEEAAAIYARNKDSISSYIETCGLDDALKSENELRPVVK